MRRSSVFLVAVAVACSGDKGPTQPSGTGAPASLTVETGDNQTGEPGTLLAVKPSVLVRDVQSRPVPNVSVIFAIDSGGGTIAGAQATTGADGIAAAGDWRLGPDEGRNTLLVVVSGVTPIRLAAHAAFASTTVATSTVTPSGGSVVVNHPGAPLDGLRFDFPAGSLPASTTITVGYQSAAGVPLPVGMTAASPLITMQSDVVVQTNLLFTMQLPAQIPADRAPIVAIVDPTSGVVSVLPVVNSDGTSVTVLSSVLSGDAIHPWLPPSSLVRHGGSVSALLHTPIRNSATGTGPFILYVVVLNAPPSDPNDVNTPFVSGRDDWEFADLPTALYPPGTGEGQVLSEWLWDGDHLHGLINDAISVWESNPLGIMLTAGITRDYDAQIGPDQASHMQHVQTSPRLYHLAAMNATILSMRYNQLYPNHSWPILLLDATGRRKMVLAIAWSAVGKYFTIVDPALPSGEEQLSFANVIMTPYPDPLDPTHLYTTPMFVHEARTQYFVPNIDQYTFGAEYDVQPAHYPGQWPHWSWYSWDSSIISRGLQAADTLFMAGDTTRIWIGATNAPYELSAALPLPANVGLQTQAVYDANANWAELSDNAADGYFIDFTNFAKPSGVPWADALIGVHAKRYETPTFLSWLGWRKIHIIKFGFAVRPVPAIPGIPVSMSISSLGGPPLPPDAKYRWDFDDGTAPVITTALSVTHTFPESAIYDVDVQILHGRTGEVIGETTSSANGGADFGISPSLTRANIGQQVNFVAAPGTTAPGISYRWSFGDQGSTTVVTNTPTVSHTYNTDSKAIGAFPVSVDLLSHGNVVAHATASAQIKNWAGAWQFTSFALTRSTPADTGAGHLVNRQVVDSIDKYMAKIISIPSDGLLFLSDDSTFIEHGVYLQVALTPGTGAFNTYYAFNTWWTMMSRTCCQAGVLNDVGTLTSGTLDGWASLTMFEGGARTSISATKQGNLLTGTIAFDQGVFDVNNQPFYLGGNRTYTFSAIKVSP